MAYFPYPHWWGYRWRHFTTRLKTASERLFIWIVFSRSANNIVLRTSTFHHSKIEFISSRHRVISFMYYNVQSLVEGPALLCFELMNSTKIELWTTRPRSLAILGARCPTQMKNTRLRTVPIATFWERGTGPSSWPNSDANVAFTWYSTVSLQTRLVKAFFKMELPPTRSSTASRIQSRTPRAGQWPTSCHTSARWATLKKPNRLKIRWAVVA